jgi:hypothetical protein
MSKPPPKSHKPKPSNGPQTEPRRGAEDERVIPVAVMGLGEIGKRIAEAARAHPRLDLVGAIDRDSRFVGQPLGKLLGDDQLRTPVVRELGQVAAKLKGGVLLLATGSRIDDVASIIEGAFKLGMHVISTCEELSYPWLYHPEVGDRLDAAAKRAGLCALGTGVNPGFVLDRLVAVAGSCTGRIVRAQATRVVDARTRRVELQRKVGAGLSEEEFDRLAEQDAIGHVGLAESCALAALGLGLDCDEVEEELAPVIAEEDVPGEAPIKTGQVAGIYQLARGFSEGREVMKLELTIAVGADDPGDTIRIEGEPSVELSIKGGYPGDMATAWAVVNAVPSVVRAEPGLLTVLDLPAGR